MLPTFADFRIRKTVFGRDMSHGSHGARPFRFAPTVLALALLCLAMKPGPAEARPPAPRPALDGGTAAGSFPLGVLQTATASDYLGLDELVTWTTWMDTLDAWTPIAITQDGEIFTAVNMVHLNLFNSTNDGQTFNEYYEFMGAPGVKYVHPVLRFAEGATRRLFVGCIEVDGLAGTRKVVVFYRDLDDIALTWETRVLSGLGNEVEAFDLTTTSDVETDYAVIAVASTPSTVAPGQIRVIRSADQGDTWAAAYAITTNPAGYDYYGPRIAPGGGDVLHVAWTKYPAVGGPGGNVETLYSRALNFAENGPGDWQGVIGVSSLYNGADEYLSAIAASRDDGQVVMSIDYGETPGFVSRTSVRASTDFGVTWNYADSVAVPGVVFTDLVAAYAETFALAGFHIASSRIAHTKTDQTAPLSWPAVTLISDVPVYHPGDPLAPYPCLDHNPRFENQFGFVWHINRPESVEPDSLFFDAEWFTNPGFPREEANYPTWIPCAPSTHPVLADADGDPELEIVFADQCGSVHFFDPDGSTLPWAPIYLGSYQLGVSVAVGDVDLDGANETVVGSINQVTVYEGDGSVAAGYPVELGPPGNGVWLAIGPILNSVSNQIVAVCERELHVLSFGADVPGFPVTAASTSWFQPAIGDVDGDGFNEIVTVHNDGDIRATRRDGSTLSVRSLGSDIIYNAPSLADFDLDGDVETVVPTYDGYVYVLDETGADISPWPIDFTDPVIGVALANIVGNPNPELVVSEEMGEITVLQFDGTVVSSWPHQAGTYTGVLSLDGPAIVDVIDEGSPDVLAGSVTDSLFAWTNLLGDVPAWPVDVGHHLQVCPASGDVDLDGSLEIVYITSDAWIFMCDVNSAPTPYADWRWPMYGFDSEQTRCLDCSIPSTVDVPDLDTGFPARLMLAPSPNPMTASSRIAFRCAPGSTATLAIYDLSGGRVRSFFDGRPAEGPQEVTWNGVDDTGRRVASGVYYVRLVVEDETGTKTESRKLIVLP